MFEDKIDVDLEEESATKIDKGVLVRVVEWGEWLPTSASDLDQLPFHNGISGFCAGESERLIDILSQNTMKTKDVIVINRDDNSEKTVVYTYYVFQATLAQNVSTSLLESLISVQRPDTEGEEEAAKRKASNLIVMKKGELVEPTRAEVRRANRLNGGN